MAKNFYDQICQKYRSDETSRAIIGAGMGDPDAQDHLSQCTKQCQVVYAKDWGPSYVAHTEQASDGLSRWAVLLGNLDLVQFPSQHPEASAPERESTKPLTGRRLAAQLIARVRCLMSICHGQLSDEILGLGIELRSLAEEYPIQVNPTLDAISKHGRECKSCAANLGALNTLG